MARFGANAVPKPIALIPLLAASALAAGCGGARESGAAKPARPASRVVERTPAETSAHLIRIARPRPARAACTDTVTAMRSPTLAYAAVVKRPTAAYASIGGKVLERFGTQNANGAATVFGVLQRGCGSWYRVQLPIKPNGVTGWVRAADVRLARVRTRIAVDLSDRRVSLWRAGRLVLETPAAIGAGATPTPTGSFYVNQRLIPADPSGPYGPGAVGVSSFSPVLTGWAQGGPIAIHGTNRPDLIGLAVSHGCVRVRNDVLRRLFDLAVPGTPVVIAA